MLWVNMPFFSLRSETIAGPYIKQIKERLVSAAEEPEKPVSPVGTYQVLIFLSFDFLTCRFSFASFWFSMVAYLL